MICIKLDGDANEERKRSAPCTIDLQVQKCNVMAMIVFQNLVRDGASLRFPASASVRKCLVTSTNIHTRPNKFTIDLR